MIRKAIKASQLFLLIMACGCLTGGPVAAGQDLSQPEYRIRPSEVSVPAEVPLGQYRRIIRPFENWTLICDENLKSRQMVCNISQTIEDGSGNLAFSWSLAATKEGKPFMILRVPPFASDDRKISLEFEGNTVEVAIKACNEAVCIGMMPVGPIMREQISRQTSPKIMYSTKEGNSISVVASLVGLKAALASIK